MNIQKPEHITNQLKSLDVPSIYDIALQIDSEKELDSKQVVEFLKRLNKINQEIIKIQEYLSKTYETQELDKIIAECHRALPSVYFKLEKFRGQQQQQIITYQSQYLNEKHKKESLQQEIETLNTKIDEVQKQLDEDIQKYNDEIEIIRQDIQNIETESKRIHDNFEEQQQEVYHKHNQIIQELLLQIEENRKKANDVIEQNCELTSQINNNNGVVDQQINRIKKLESNVKEAMDEKQSAMHHLEQVYQQKLQQYNELIKKQQQMGESDAQAFQNKVKLLIKRHITVATSELVFLISNKQTMLTQLISEEGKLIKQLEDLKEQNQLIQKTNNLYMNMSEEDQAKTLQESQSKQHENNVLSAQNIQLVQQIALLYKKLYNAELDQDKINNDSEYLFKYITEHKRMLEEEKKEIIIDKQPTNNEIFKVIQTINKQKRETRREDRSKSEQVRIRNTLRDVTTIINDRKKSRYKLWRINYEQPQ